MSLPLIVLDTNVLVSALLSPFGPPARVLDLALSGEVRLVFDDRVLAEYREVLARAKFGCEPRDIAEMLAYLEAEGESVTARPLAASLPDPDDAPLLEVAAQADAWLVTGNRTHCPEDLRGNVRVLAPAEFVAAWQAGA